MLCYVNVIMLGYIHFWLCLTVLSPSTGSSALIHVCRCIAQTNRYLKRAL